MEDTGTTVFEELDKEIIEKEIVRKLQKKKLMRQLDV
jgi:hypothetical protein